MEFRIIVHTEHSNAHYTVFDKEMLINELEMYKNKAKYEKVSISVYNGYSKNPMDILDIYNLFHSEIGYNKNK
jgi:uncharacterized membrane protein YkvA (DUF1232 family)